jgi:hypothetical protein
MIRCTLPLLSVFGLLGLAACGASPPPPVAFCPQPAVLQQANTLTLFLPGRQDVGGQVTTAKITGIAGACTLAQAKHLLRVTFRAGFSASNGPANHAAKLTLPYFVAISNGDNVISKSPYSITLNFDGNASTASATSDPVKIELSNVPESAQVEVLIGFQMTPDQVAYAAAHPDGT